MIGNGLAYATGGFAKARLEHTGAGGLDEAGYVMGGGYEYMLNPRVTLGGEALYHQFNSFGGTQTDIELWTVTARAALRF